MGYEDWAGCLRDICAYGKEYGDCDNCKYLIRKEDEPSEEIKDIKILE